MIKSSRRYEIETFFNFQVVKKMQLRKIELKIISLANSVNARQQEKRTNALCKSRTEFCKRHHLRQSCFMCRNFCALLVQKTGGAVAGPKS